MPVLTTDGVRIGRREVGHRTPFEEEDNPSAAWDLSHLCRRAVGAADVTLFRSPPVVYRSNIRLLVVLGVIPDALKTAGCAQSRAVNDFVHTSTFLVNFGSVSSLFEVFQTCENLY